MTKASRKAFHLLVWYPLNQLTTKDLNGLYCNSLHGFKTFQKLQNSFVILALIFRIDFSPLRKMISFQFERMKAFFPIDHIDASIGNIYPSICSFVLLSGKFGQCFCFEWSKQQREGKAAIN